MAKTRLFISLILAAVVLVGSIYSFLKLSNDTNRPEEKGSSSSTSKKPDSPTVGFLEKPTPKQAKGNGHQSSVPLDSGLDLDNLDLPIPRTSEYDLGAYDSASKAEVMKEWEAYTYVEVTKETIPDIVKRVNIRTHAAISEEQLDRFRDKYGQFLTMYSNVNPESLLTLHNADKSEFDRNDADTQKRTAAMKQVLQQLKLSDNEIPSDYLGVFMEFTKQMLKTTGPVITSVALNQSEVVIDEVPKSKYVPSEWDPQNASSDLWRRYTLMGQSVSGARSGLSSPSFRERMKQPHDVLYADIRMPFKSEPDPANYAVFRFVWDDEVSHWAPMSAIWFYNGEREKFFIW